MGLMSPWRSTAREPRLELAPLLDVIFLLLTFFIYSQVLLMRSNILPVALPSLATATEAEPAEVWGITLDKQGRLFLNEKPIDLADLRLRLRELAGQPDPPMLYLAMADEQGQTDRLPLFVRVMDYIREAGIEEYSIVGRPPGR
jgi:biopolymer transport protein ExbD